MQWLIAVAAVSPAASTQAAILWSDLGATLVHESGIGSDMLAGAVRRDDASADALYLKFHIDPLSDSRTEEYLAALQLFEGGVERLGVGNSMKAWAYSVFNAAGSGEFNRVFGDLDLNSSRPESSGVGTFFPYELPRRGIETTIVFKVQYVAGDDDVVRVWLNPDLSPGATEASQPTNLITSFSANASFDEIRLRHEGGGGGWIFSDMAVTTSFSDFVSAGSGEPGSASIGAGRGALPFAFRSWQREQGLPQNAVRALAQTREGYLWIGSDDGVVRFDGVRFVAFGLREGLRSVRVRALCADSRGALWIGTVGGGLTRLQDGQLATYTIRDGLPADSITALAEDGEGRLWVGTEAGLAVWQDGRMTPPSAAEEFKGRTITTLFRDRQGTLWVGATGAGVFQFAAAKFVRLTDASVEGLLQDPHCLLVDQAGRIWVGAGDDFVLCREGQQWRRYRIPRHLARPFVSALAEEPDGTVWAGSAGEGLFRFKEGKLTALTASSGLSDTLVEALLVDREGKLWVGTGAGLNRLQRKNLTAFGPNEGLGYGAVQGLAEIAPGLIWVAKLSDGLYRWEGKSFNRVAIAELAGRYAQVNALLMTQDGSCWVAGVHGLLRFPDPQGAADEAELSALAKVNVISLAEDRDGALWAGTREGELWRLQHGVWAAHTNHSQAHAITAITHDLQGSTWIGTEGNGLYRFKDQTRAHFQKGGGLLSDFIRTLYLDAEGSLWIGTAGGGLSRWREGKGITTFTTREGLPDNTISQILEDDRGRLWLGNNRGIACVSKRELEELAAGRIPAVYPQLYGRAEGMLSEECTGGFFPAGLKTRSGRLCFSTLKGLVVVEPRAQTADAPGPAVVIEEIIVDGEVQRYQFRVSGSPASGPERPTARRDRGALDSRRQPANSKAETLRLAPGRRRFEFHYTALSFDAPELVRFRHRLEGLDADWVEAGTRRTAFYNYVPPGDYRFRVLACNSEGVWNEAGASVAFTVLPHFWQAWWFLTLAGLGLLASVGGVVRFVEKKRLHRRLKHLEQERALERERARIAQDLHDDLGSSLARISLLSTLAREDKHNPAQVETHVSRIAQSADDTVRALEEIVWAVRPGSDSLQSLVDYIAHFANELFDGNGTRCRLDLPHDLPALPLPPDVRHNIFLIVKEALTNVVKHAAAREVRVEAKASARSLEIMVKDDGRGFEPEALRAVGRSGPEAPPGGGNRNGLGNMRRRAEAIGGTLRVQSAPGEGTAVQLAVNFPT